MKKIFLFLLVVASFGSLSVSAKTDNEEPLEEVDGSIVIDRISNDDIQVILPSMIFSFSDVDVKLKFKNPGHTKLLLNKNKIEFLINGEITVLEFVNGEASFKHKFDKSKSLSILVEDFSYDQKVTVYPLWAILIPVILIVLFILKRMIKK